MIRLVRLGLCGWSMPLPVLRVAMGSLLCSTNDNEQKS
jgi:hypothetical protein